MEQHEIIMILQKRANRNKYNDVAELSLDVHLLGGSYIVMSWMDKYCLTRDLYRDNDFK